MCNRLLDKLNLFYQEPETDRWVPYDRYPRKAFREFLYATGIRQRRPSGHRMVYQNLKKGLDRIGIPYRDNDFSYIRSHPDELMCIVGKPHLLLESDWPNPMVFGACVFDHPAEHPNFWEQNPNVRKMLIPGPWMYHMFAEHYPEDRLEIWPGGIDVDEWRPHRSLEQKPKQILLYDKVLWNREARRKTLVEPIRRYMEKNGVDVEVLRYGEYFPEDLRSALQRCRAAVYLCEHETQGIAYQQMLASGTPIFAWGKGGYWEDPDYFPDRVQYEPVTSVPYWDERCGQKFKDLPEFKEKFETFWKRVRDDQFEPRAFIVENLTLEKCARHYVSIAEEVVEEDREAQRAV